MARPITLGSKKAVACTSKNGEAAAPGSFFGIILFTCGTGGRWVHQLNHDWLLGLRYVGNPDTPPYLMVYGIPDPFHDGSSVLRVLC